MSRLLHPKRRQKGKVPRVKRKRDPFLVQPDRDWVIFFITAVAANLLIIGLHAFIFYRIIQGNLFDSRTPTVTSATSVDRDTLSETLEYFRKRESDLLEAVATVPPVPSVR